MGEGMSKEKHQVGVAEFTSLDREQNPSDQPMTCPKALPILITKTTNILSTTATDWPTLPLTVLISPQKLGQTRPKTHYCCFGQGWNIVATTNAQQLGADRAVGRKAPSPC